MRRCQDEKMWRREDVKMRRCEHAKMWRCRDQKMWRWEAVKMRRCFRDPHYWKNPASDALGKKFYACHTNRCNERFETSKMHPSTELTIQTTVWSFTRTVADGKATSNEYTLESRSQNEIGIFTTHSEKKLFFKNHYNNLKYFNQFIIS